jgi:hypothetical protein
VSKQLLLPWNHTATTFAERVTAKVDLISKGGDMRVDEYAATIL